MKLIDVAGVIVFQNNNLQSIKSGVLYINAGKLNNGIYMLLVSIDGQEYKQKIIVKN